MGPPEAVGRAVDMFNWCEQNGCRATAAVVKNALQKGLLERRFTTVVKVFNNKQKALTDSKSSEALNR